MMDLPDLYKKQISLTEWFESINHKDSKVLRLEDNEKRERLAVLNELIGLPFDRPVNFSASDVVNRSPEFASYLEEHGEEKCALRLIPLVDELPKLRMRGQKIKDVVAEWLPKQNIDPSSYRADFVPHPETNFWATIFVVTPRGIFGEIIADGHHLLTQGFYESKKPIVFSYDFNEWVLSPSNEAALDYLKSAVAFLKIGDDKKAVLSEKLNAEFSHDYLIGYFETTHSEFGTWFIDYNQTLGKLYEGFSVVKQREGEISGQVGCTGLATGSVAVVEDPSQDIEEGSILVCDMTSPEFVPLMKKAAAIVTNRGGILSHAAIISRELKIPCILGTGNATSLLSNGDKVTVDANTGVVHLMK